MKHSAGIAIVNPTAQTLFLGHPGGPFYRGKDEGVWSMPKGCFNPSEEDALDAAIREFEEETGVALPLDRSKFAALDPIPGKHKTLYPYVVNFWALPQETRERLLDLDSLKSNTCEVEFKGQTITIPEIDKFNWFHLDLIRYYLAPRQTAIVDAVETILTPKEA